MTDLFPTAEQHTHLAGRRVHDPIHRGTGLWQEHTINGRPATDDELAAMERAYQTGRDRDAALVRVAPPHEPSIELRLGGRNPGLYIDGERVE